MGVCESQREADEMEADVDAAFGDQASDEAKSDESTPPAEGAMEAPADAVTSDAPAATSSEAEGAAAASTDGEVTMGTDAEITASVAELSSQDNTDLDHTDKSEIDLATEDEAELASTAATAKRVVETSAANPSTEPTATATSVSMSHTAASVSISHAAASQLKLQHAEAASDPLDAGFEAQYAGSDAKYDDAALEAEAAEIFGAADKDNNKVLSHTELKKYIQANSEVRKRLLIIGAGEDCGWHGLFTDADEDGDGEITLAEFNECFKRKAMLYKKVEEAEAAEAQQNEEAEAQQNEGATSDPLDAAFEAQHKEAAASDPLDAAFEAQHEQTTAADPLDAAFEAQHKEAAASDPLDAAFEEQYADEPVSPRQKIKQLHEELCAVQESLLVSKRKERKPLSQRAAALEAEIAQLNHESGC